MGETRSWVHGVLRFPRLYQSIQDWLSKSDAFEILISSYIRPHEGCRLLDVGCGPGSLLNFLGDVDYVGIDRNEGYIRHARDRFAGRGEFLLADVRELVSGKHAPFDVITIMGLLHHLDDQHVLELLATLRRLLTPSGRLISVDPCLVDRQNPVARLLIRMDRGQNIRTEEQYRELATMAFPMVDLSVRGDLLRIPYDHAIMVCHA